MTKADFEGCSSDPVTGVLTAPSLSARDFIYHRPTTPSEVDYLLQRNGASAALLAGGTDLLVQIRSGHMTPRHVVDLIDVETASEIKQLDSGRVEIAASARISSLVANESVMSRFPALLDGMVRVGSLQIQNIATLVGNICNASPAADTAPALLIYDTVVKIRSVERRRSVPISEFWLGPGRTVLESHEWVESLVLADPGLHGSAYVKLGRTRGVDLALVGVAYLSTGSHARVAAASIAATPRRLGRTEESLSVDEGDIDWTQVNQALCSEISPISDLRATANYRQQMALVCCRRACVAGRRRLHQAEEGWPGDA